MAAHISVWCLYSQNMALMTQAFGDSTYDMVFTQHDGNGFDTW